MAISKIKENSLASGAVTESNVGADIINAQTELAETANDADFILVYDTSAGGLKKVLKSNFTLQVPTITSISPTNALTGDGTGNHTFTITGTNFTGAAATLINDSGSNVAFDSVTVDSATQITGVIAKSSLPGSGEPYDVKVTAANGLATTLVNQVNVDQQPVFSTAAGSLGTTADSLRGSFSAITIAAADPESGGDVVYTIESGSLPAGLSGASTSSGYVISGTPDAVGSDTTSNFTIRAKDVNSNTSDRAYSLTINAPVSQSFTSSGTFSVPSGISSVNVLVVAGGGSGGDNQGAGGAGGLIYRPGFSVTPGGTVSVTVGEGAAGNSGGSAPYGDTTGQDSVFGTLTAKGGGSGGVEFSNSGNGNPGGSGGGGVYPAGGYGNALQPLQSGDSGNYGFGNIGGNGQGNSPYNTGGGGGAGAAGGQASNPQAGHGGAGKAYTIADGTTSVYYAGGGGGGATGAGALGQGGQGGGGDGGRGSSHPDGALAGQAGTANRGGGGGSGSEAPHPGGANPGGKGIVIVQY